MGDSSGHAAAVTAASRHSRDGAARRPGATGARDDATGRPVKGGTSESPAVRVERIGPLRPTVAERPDAPGRSA